MKRITAILSVGFLLAMASSAALGFIAEPIFWLDAGDNPAHPDGWTNLGAAGGVLLAELPPALEADAGPDGTPTYTATEAGQSFGGAEEAVSLFFEDWTIELMMKYLGQAVGGGEHQLFCLIDTPWPFTQCILLRFGGDAGTQINLSICAADSAGVDNMQHILSNVDVRVEEWHHVAFTFDDSDGMLRSYMDGKRVGEDETIQDYNSEVEMKANSIFRSGYWDNADRVFHGSISVVRAYDRALSDDEILGNFNNPRTIAVEPADKLAETWGKVKMSH